MDLYGKIINMRKLERIFLMGGGASGKDHAKSELIKLGFKADVSYTTRPPREGEIDGEDYHFISETEFLRMIANGEFIQWNMYGEFCYGTSMDSFNESNVFIITPNIIEEIAKHVSESGANVIFYINISEEIRDQRLISRGMSELDAHKRLMLDRKFYNDDIESVGCHPCIVATITDPTFNIKEIIESLCKKIGVETPTFQ